MERVLAQDVDYPTPHDLSTEGHHRSRGLVAAMLCATCVLHFGSEARAQCSARDVLQTQLLKPEKASPAGVSVAEIRSALDVPVWKAITLGTFSNSLALRNAFDAIGCNIGGSAAEILARPDFIVSSTRKSVQLVTVSAVELGFKTDTVTLAAIYRRAEQLGFELAAAEVGPQLRLQYFDQPIGEFLIIGMQPIKTWSGEQVVLNVANGGAGLVLIGQDGRADAEISSSSRVVFARPSQAAAITRASGQRARASGPARGYE